MEQARKLVVTDFMFICKYFFSVATDFVTHIWQSVDNTMALNDRIFQKSCHCFSCTVWAIKPFVFFSAKFLLFMSLHYAVKENMVIWLEICQKGPNDRAQNRSKIEH